ncbi:MAG: hypothetical protein NDJ89_08795 [Oligoflexia bacterium]|nr:hypothetical protein [Oligoflexia bacterium]
MKVRPFRFVIVDPDDDLAIGYEKKRERVRRELALIPSANNALSKPRAKPTRDVPRIFGTQARPLAAPWHMAQARGRNLDQQSCEVIDEIHTIVGAGAVSGGALDAANEPAPGAILASAVADVGKHVQALAPTAKIRRNRGLLFYAQRCTVLCSAFSGLEIGHAASCSEYAAIEEPEVEYQEKWPRNLRSEATEYW